MSNTPSGFPMPGGGYYVQPPPRGNNNAGCLKSFGITCGVLFVIIAIGLIVLVRYVKGQISHPDSGIFGTSIRAVHAGADGIAIQRAIVSYHAKNGRYPQNLTQLVMDGETDGRILHNSLDANPSPAHISWQYTPPAEGAPGNTPILQEPYTITIGNQSQTANVVINLDGSSGNGKTMPIGNGMPSNSS